MPDERQHDDEADAPWLAIRRHTDRCFHAVEEVVPIGPGSVGPADFQQGGVDMLRARIRGYIIEGVMIDADDVADVRLLDKSRGMPACE